MGLDADSLVRVFCVDFDGNAQPGELVVATDVTEALVDVFPRPSDARFPIARREREDASGADVAAIRNADDTSGSRRRRVPGSWDGS